MIVSCGEEGYSREQAADAEICNTGAEKLQLASEEPACSKEEKCGNKEQSHTLSAGKACPFCSGEYETCDHYEECTYSEQELAVGEYIGLFRLCGVQQSESAKRRFLMESSGRSLSLWRSALQGSRCIISERLWSRQVYRLLRNSIEVLSINRLFSKARLLYSSSAGSSSGS